MPACASSKNQDWNFPEAHFLSFNPQSRTTAAKSAPQGQVLGGGKEQSPPGMPPSPVHLSTQKPLSYHRRVYAFPSGSFLLSSKKGIQDEESHILPRLWHSSMGDPHIGFFALLFSFLRFYSFISERERERENTSQGEGQKEREVDSPMNRESNTGLHRRTPRS